MMDEPVPTLTDGLLNMMAAEKERAAAEKVKADAATAAREAESAEKARADVSAKAEKAKADAAARSALVPVPTLTDEQKRDGLLNMIRSDRNKKLSESDWSQFTDNGLSSEKKTEWVTYRQALRDLPSTLTIDPNGTYVSTWNSITWPTHPQ
jgi:hypothetical protein